MTTRKLQSNLFKILVDTTKILDDFDIPYFLAYGTMLGAIRHKGFIPWDDDVDIAVKREDYDRLISCLSKNLDSDTYFIQNYHTDEQFPHTFTRICLKNSVAIQRHWQKLDMQHKVFIDIFPLDTVDNFGKKFTIKAKLIEIIFILKTIKARQFTINRKKTAGINDQLKFGIKYFLAFILNFVSMKTLNKIQENIQINNHTQGKYYVNFFSGTPMSIKAEACDFSVFTDRFKVPFEKKEFYIPIDYELLLTRKYGDYMKYPKKTEQKGNHDFIKLQLDKEFTNLLNK